MNADWGRSLLLYVFVPLLLSLASTGASADELTATVDRNQLSRGETVELRVRFDSQDSGEPDFSVLQEDFEILSRRQQNQFSLINGKAVSYTEWLLELLPRETGDILIPELDFKGVNSEAITLQVEDRRPAAKGKEPIFVETELDKTTAYVQEQLLLTLRVFTSEPLLGLSSDGLSVDNASILQLAENQYNTRENGVMYQVNEIKYVLFPEASGELVIPQVRLNTAIPDRRDPFSGSLFGNRSKRVLLYSEEQKVTIMPRPANSGNGAWLPAKGLSLTERWSRSPEELVAGEPITRTVTLTAQQLTATQLPPLQISDGDGYKIYPDQPQMDNNGDRSGVIGSRIESMAIVPSRAGTITLPPLTVQWWDTVSQQPKQAVLEARTLTVKAAAGPVPDITETEETDTAEPIMTPALKQEYSLLTWVLIGMNLLLLVTVAALFLLWRSSRERAPATPPMETVATPNEATLFAELQRQSKGQDPRAFCHALLHWAKVYWNRPFLTLQDVAASANNRDLAITLEALDRALYGNITQQAISLPTIHEQLKQLRKNQKGVGEQQKGTPLAPLYGK
ncbi:BatD family protein [Porticoccus sp.]|uniref:BatD family protein n=1 Tax=Porticoccus sp. TaxID=2024853 RepID=UPI003F69C89E